MPTIRPPTTSANAATTNPFTMTGSAWPRNRAAAGRRHEQVAERPLEALARDGEDHREEQGHGRVLIAFPIT